MAYGGYRGADQLIGEDTRAAMRTLLGDIRSGRYAEEWIAENRDGCPRFSERRKAELLAKAATAG